MSVKLRISYYTLVHTFRSDAVRYTGMGDLFRSVEIKIEMCRGVAIGLWVITRVAVMQWWVARIRIQRFIVRRSSHSNPIVVMGPGVFRVFIK